MIMTVVKISLIIIMTYVESIINIFVEIILIITFAGVVKGALSKSLVWFLCLVKKIFKNEVKEIDAFWFQY